MVISENTKPRYDYVDEMKGLAILLVVLGHLFLPHTKDGTLNACATIIYSFHMSFFFFLSGYINEKTNRIATKGYKTYLSKKIKTLIIPFLFWSFIPMIFFQNIIPTTWNDILEPFRIYPNRHYWFLPILFLFMVFYSAKSLITKNGKCDLIFSGSIASIFIVGGGVLHQYFIIVYGIFWISFIFGDYLSKFVIFQKLIRSSIAYGIAAIILCISWKIYPIHPTDAAWKSMANLALMLICSISASIVFYNFFRIGNYPNWMKKYFRELGKFSLVIYLVPITILPQNYIFPSELSTSLVNLSILLIAIITTLLRYCFGRIVFEIPYLRFIMFGKK